MSRRWSRAVAPAGLLLVLGGGLALADEPPAAPSGPEVAKTEAAASPPSAVDPAVGAAFSTIAQVLLHPRCRNCHPNGDRPLQGDDPRPHAMNIQRGLEAVGLACATCHGEENLDGPRLPPGAPHWGLAPAEQVFEGRSPAELCRQLVDPATNGDRTLQDLLHHMTEDPLVLWGWDPGEGRAPVSVPQPEFAAAVRAWVAAGGPCPEEKE